MTTVQISDNRNRIIKRDGWDIISVCHRSSCLVSGPPRGSIYGPICFAEYRKIAAGPIGTNRKIFGSFRDTRYFRLLPTAVLISFEIFRKTIFLCHTTNHGTGTWRANSKANESAFQVYRSRDTEPIERSSARASRRSSAANRAL